MTRLLWITDPHLNFLPHPDSVRQFGISLRETEEFDAIVVTGDIAEAPSIRHLLTEFVSGAQVPTYFILGNHDYYEGSFESVRESLQDLPPNLVWLDHADSILLDEETALVGHQGWFDGRAGDPEGSRVIMNDFRAISDLRPFYNRRAWEFYGSSARTEMLAKVRELGDQAAAAAKVSLEAALAQRETVIFATHFPPFPGACWHQGELSDPHWRPWFTCVAMGEMLAELSERYPDNRILTLCGHTHSQGIYNHAPNLKVLTGKAKYYAPDHNGILQTPIRSW